MESGEITKYGVCVCCAHGGKLSETDYKSPQLTVWKKSMLLLRYTEKSIKAYGKKTLMAITIKHFFSLHLHTFGTQMNTACAVPMIIKTSIDISFSDSRALSRSFARSTRYLVISLIFSVANDLVSARMILHELATDGLCVGVQANAHLYIFNWKCAPCFHKNRANRWMPSF